MELVTVDGVTPRSPSEAARLCDMLKVDVAWWVGRMGCTLHGACGVRGVAVVLGRDGPLGLKVRYDFDRSLSFGMECVMITHVDVPKMSVGCMILDVVKV